MFHNNRVQHIIILKGAGTIVATTEGATQINTTGNPGMATGGMGDVLSGLIGALTCQGLEPHDAAAAAVFLHGAAADSLYEQDGNGYTASDVAKAIPFSLKSLLKIN
jgi:NAD(P)H-hydrate epimerase